MSRPLSEKTIFIREHFLKGMSAKEIQQAGEKKFGTLAKTQIYNAMSDAKKAGLTASKVAPTALKRKKRKVEMLTLPVIPASRVAMVYGTTKEIAELLKEIA